MNTTTNTETESNLDVANTIVDQINHRDFWARARWGVKQMLGDRDGVMFNCNKRIKIQIQLDRATDTYTVEIGRMRGLEYKPAETTSGVHDTELVAMIDGMFSRAYGRL